MGATGKDGADGGHAGMADVSAAEFDRLLSETLDALKPGAKEGVSDEQAREPLRGQGEALDGLVGSPRDQVLGCRR